MTKRAALRGRLFPCQMPGLRQAQPRHCQCTVIGNFGTSSSSIQ